MNNKCAFVVYLVDDDTGVLKALTRVLNSRGYEVLAFSSPSEFLARHDPSIPGCAIFDVSMPGLDGIELQAALKAAVSSARLFSSPGSAIFRPRYRR